MHSLITSLSHNGKVGSYEVFRNHTHLPINSQKCRDLLICGSVIANFNKVSSIFAEKFSKFNTLNFGTGGDKNQNVQ